MESDSHLIDTSQLLDYPYSIYATTETDEYFKSLTTMKEFMINESYKNQGLCFLASPGGVYVVSLFFMNGLIP